MIVILSSVAVWLFIFFMPLSNLVKGVGFTVSTVFFLVLLTNIITRRPEKKAIDEGLLLKKEKERAKYRKQSLSHIKSELLFLIFSIVIIWCIENFLFEIPLFLKVIVLSISVLALVQDVLNVIYLRKRQRHP